ncbi:hypothetical protein JQS43_12270 [Natronosporangium hydrolyticum]|uniref:Lipoprotein n=1 Tax=Natronosporangium hydrolyticum TaxID=2811111 RepID=A0A895YS90_9ACTN|nr:hypothetical protein [Natronosporangium hydrolyticum]QSB16970.1 hypothetical protein JQS43_12270 [Natronosporangium hydrolyticum]
MRRPLMTITAVAALTLALAGCGGDDEPDDPPPAGGEPAPSPTVAPPTDPGPPEHGWEEQATVDFETGEITAEGFNDLIDSETPQWAADPVDTVEVLLHLDEPAGTVDIDQAGGGDAPTVVVTVSDLADGSVEAIRYEIELATGDDELYRFDTGQASWRCQPERGHQDFDTEPCL